MERPEPAMRFDGQEQVATALGRDVDLTFTPIVLRS
jgi:hypothetical protein